MNKKFFLAITLISLFLTACAGSQGQTIAPEAKINRDAQYTDMGSPVEMPASAPEPADMGYQTGVNQAGSTTDRMVIKNANLTLVVLDPEQSLNEIILLADQLGGFVVSSNIYQTRVAEGIDVPRASVTIRVPADKFTQSLDQIKAKAKRVDQENISGQDVTREYTDLKSRLKNLERAEEQLSLIMEKAYKTEDVLSVYNQLVQVREQIELIQGQMQYYEQSVSFSAISMELIADAAAKPLTVGGWEPVGIAKDALQALIKTFQSLANLLIWLVMYFLPVLVLAAIPLVLVFRYFRNRRRRKQAVHQKESEPNK